MVASASEAPCESTLTLPLLITLPAIYALQAAFARAVAELISTPRRFTSTPDAPTYAVAPPFPVWE